MITMSSIVPGNNNPLRNRLINSSAEESSVSEVGIIQDVNNDVYLLSEQYDGVVSVSGDGGLHEIINGLFKRNEAMDSIRIGNVPGGSGRH